MSDGSRIEWTDATLESCPRTSARNQTPANQAEDVNVGPPYFHGGPSRSATWGE